MPLPVPLPLVLGLGLLRSHDILHPNTEQLRSALLPLIVGFHSDLVIGLHSGTFSQSFPSIIHARAEGPKSATKFEPQIKIQCPGTRLYSRAFI